MKVSLLEAHTAAAAVELARVGRPDVVVLDLGLPDAGGDEVLAALRADPATREVPVLVFTSKQIRMGDRERLREASAILSKKDPDASLRSALQSLFKEAEADR